MPSTPSTLLARLSSKFSHLLQNRETSPRDNLPITLSGLAFQRERGRKLTRDETDVLYAQALWDVEDAPGLAADTTSGTNSSDEERWSWYDSDERQFSVAKGVSDTDLSAGSGREDWRQDWEPIKMRLKEGAQRRAVVTTILDRGLCDYDYPAALKALEAMKEPEPESKEDRRAKAFLDTAMERFEEAKREMRMVASRTMFRRGVRKQLRQVALGDSDDEEEEGIVCSKDPGSMRPRDGEVACGDWPIDWMMMAGGGDQNKQV